MHVFVNELVMFPWTFLRLAVLFAQQWHQVHGSYNLSVDSNINGFTLGLGIHWQVKTSGGQLVAEKSSQRTFFDSILLTDDCYSFTFQPIKSGFMHDSTDYDRPYFYLSLNNNPLSLP